MKFDMHCHTKEGSLDAKVDIETYIKTLIDKGFDGMLVTDHNSYKGYEKWNELSQHINLSKPFTVLKGIEYDTSDGGHFIAVLPDNIHCKLLEIRGMTLMELEKLVHGLGGILGPAHPFDTGYYAYMNTHSGKKMPELIHKFDFIETFNSCAKTKANQLALQLAKKFNKPHFAGSDAHRLSVIGSAFTDFEDKILTNNDLINFIKNKQQTNAGSHIIESLHTNVNIVIEKLGIVGYWIYNKLGALMNKRKRQLEKSHLRHIFYNN